MCLSTVSAWLSSSAACFCSSFAMFMYWAPFRTCEYTTYAMMAWYSRARSSFSPSINCCRVTVDSLHRLAFAAARRSRQIRVRAWDLLLARRLTACTRLTRLRAVRRRRAIVSAQTMFTPPPNSYTPAQDVELGRQGRRDRPDSSSRLCATMRCRRTSKRSAPARAGDSAGARSIRSSITRSSR